MMRMFAAVALLAALGVLSKLAFKGGDAGTPRPGPGARDEAPARDVAADPDAEILAKYPDDRPLVDRVLRKYRRTARAIEATDGLRGLVLLDRLDLEAIHLYEKYPNDFRRLRDSLTDDAAADVLLHWREYFGLKRADDTDRGILIAEVARLSPAARRVAARYPNVLPFLLAEPQGVTELVRNWSGDPEGLKDALVVLEFISLEPGATDLRAALRTLEAHGTIALEAMRLQGMDGFALVSLYGPVLEALGDALPLDQALILLRVNAGYVDERLRTGTPEALAADLRHVAAAGLVEAVGGSPDGLRLLVEHGEAGERALAQVGPDAADVAYADYADAESRARAVGAMAEHGKMAAAMLAKYRDDADFRAILRDHGAAVIPPIAQADAVPEALSALRARHDRSLLESASLGILFLSGDNGQATIRTIKKDGLARVTQLNSSDVEFYQFLPLYDLVHLGGVLGRGHAPTSGELTWALVDGCFVVADALSLAAVQPEGVVAAEAARAEVKAASREAVKALGRELAEEGVEVGAKAAGRRGAEAAAERLARWWTVRLAGGTYQVLRRLPEAVGRLGVVELSDLARPLCARAGLRLSSWAPIRFLAATGPEIVRRIPPSRGIKYLAAQAVQAGVGVVAFQKMEEHLASRRPHPPGD